MDSLAFANFVTGEGDMTTVTVASASELKTALSSLTSGGTIYLAHGNYGELTLRNFRTQNGIINLKALDASHMPHFDKIWLEDSSNIQISNVDVGQALRAGQSDEGSAIRIQDSQNVCVTGSRIHGSLDGNPGNDASGIIIRGSRSVTVSDSQFQDLHRGVATSFSSQVTISRNSIHGISEDGLDFAQVSNVRVLGNEIGEFSSIKNHPDAIQFMTTGTTASSSHIEIRDNVILQGSGAQMQGIFMRDELGSMPFIDVKISNNMIYTDQWNGIALFHARGASLTNNSVLSARGDSIHDRVRLADVSHGSAVGNVAEAFIFERSPGLDEAGNLNLSKGHGDGSSYLGRNEHSQPSLSDLLFAGIGYRMTGHGSSIAPLSNGGEHGDSGPGEPSTTAHSPVAESAQFIFPLQPITSPAQVVGPPPIVHTPYQADSIAPPPSFPFRHFLHAVFGEHFAIG